MTKHPDGEGSSPIQSGKQKLQTLSGTVHSSWEEDSPITSNGYLPYFAEYLQAGGLFKAWCNDCPLEYSSNNAPKVKDVLGTAMLSILSGHQRYAHTSTLFGDKVAAEVMGMNKVVSHDSMARGLAKMNEQEATRWMQRHLIRTYEPLLAEPYILDVDPTVKPIYGKQEGAAVGYNPKKPGRPSLCYHTYFIANLRLAVDVDVRHGNQTAGCYSHEVLWSFLDSLDSPLLPSLIRGDIGFGNEGTMVGCEARKVNFLFKLSQTVKVKNLLEKLSTPGYEWHDNVDGWKSYDTSIRLQGWSKERRIVVFRRQTSAPHQELKALPPAEKDQLELALDLVSEDTPSYEWRVLITDLDYSPRSLWQLYCDRADCENIIDEIKNQWGWGGFVSHELKQTRLMARIIAMVYNWWTIFCRLASPDKHMEAVTSRPALQSVIGRMVKTNGQRILRLCATGDTAQWAMQALSGINTFIAQNLTATQLNVEECWCKILDHACRHFLKKNSLKPVRDGSQFLLLLE